MFLIILCHLKKTLYFSGEEIKSLVKKVRRIVCTTAPLIILSVLKIYPSRHRYNNYAM